MHRKLQYVLSDLSYLWCLQPRDLQAFGGTVQLTFMRS